MSTPAQTPNNDQLLADNGIQQPVVEGQVGQPTEPAQLQREYVIQTETGQTYKGKTQAEVIEQLKKAVEEGTKTIAQFNKERKQVVQQTVAQEPQYNPDEYWRLAGEDPMKANNYLKQFDPDYKQTRQQLEEINMQRTIDTFKAAHEDLPLDADSTAKFEQVYNKFNLPLTVDSLELVWAYAKANNILTPVSQQQTPTQPLAPPPSLDSSSSGPTGGFDVNAMTPEQIRELIERGGR